MHTKIDFTQRNVGIDLFRALTMFVMIFVNDFWKIHDVPHWLEHAKRGEDFLGLADVVYPCFLFVVGMSIPFAIERRYSKGMTGESTIGHILSRTLALLVMGAFITNSEARLSPDVSYRIGVYWILMVTAFIFIWNHYPRTDNPNHPFLFSGHIQKSRWRSLWGPLGNTRINWMGVPVLCFYLCVHPRPFEIPGTHMDCFCDHMYTGIPYEPGLGRNSDIVTPPSEFL